MTAEELEIKAKEYSDKTEFTEYDNYSLSESLDISEEIKKAYIAGAKAMQEENELLAKRICELQSDLSRVKSFNEKMKRCSNCVHRFVRHFSQEGTCQRPNCKNYSEWCFDGKRP